MRFAWTRPRLRGCWSSWLVALSLLASICSAHQLPANAPTTFTSDVYVPVHAASTAALLRGDGACVRALGGGAGAELRFAEAFEGWHAALAESEVGDTVATGLRLSEQDARNAQLVALANERFPDRDHSFQRRTEAVEVAVLRRLSGLTPSERQAWTKRFETRAAERLSAWRSQIDRPRALLVALERRYPATRAALRAAALLFELDFEAGRPLQADDWLRRAERHAALLGGGAEPALLRSIELRRTLLLPWLTLLSSQAATSPVPARQEPAWMNATSFEQISVNKLELATRVKFAQFEGQPGLAFLDGDRFAVQSTRFVFLFSPTDGDRIFEPWLIGHELGHPIASTATRTGRDWPMFPRARGEDLFVVSGRSDGESSNLLQRIRAPRGIELPIAVWSLGGAGLFREGGEHQSLEQVLEPGIWEFQPGPLPVEDLLVVQARQWSQVERDGRSRATSPGEARVWLLALDVATGLPRWKRFLCRGSDIVDDFGLGFARESLIRTPAQCPTQTRRGVFVGTNLGAGFLFDLADGRLSWSLRNKRRAPTELGWRSGLRSPSTAETSRDEEIVLWAPSDSDELYALSTQLDFAARESHAPAPLVPYPPLALDESECLIGGRPDQVLTLGRAGAHRTLSAHNLLDGRRFDSIYLGRGEDYLVGALLSPSRVLFAADGGLYALDRTRELYLSAFHPLHLTSDFAAGGLWARGEDLYLLAQGALYHFRMR